MDKTSVVAIYVDTAKWMELLVSSYCFDTKTPLGFTVESVPRNIANGIMDAWLKETALDDFPYDPNWEKDEEWSLVGFYGDENNATYTAIFSPYRGERVTFVFFT